MAPEVRRPRRVSGTARLALAAVGVVVFGVALGGCVSFQAKPIVPLDVLRDLQRVRLEGLTAVAPAPARRAGPSLRPLGRLVRGRSGGRGSVSQPRSPGVPKGAGRRRGRGGGCRRPAESRARGDVALHRELHQEPCHQRLGRELAVVASAPGERAARRAQAEARLANVRRRSRTRSGVWRPTCARRTPPSGGLRSGGGWPTRPSRSRSACGGSCATSGRSATRAGSRRTWSSSSTRRRCRERETIVADEERTRQELNRALGLPPLSVASLQARDGFAYRPLRLSPAVLETVMVDHRPDLKAAEEEYEQSQQALRLAYIQRIPWFRFGPSYERDGARGKDPSTSWGSASASTSRWRT